MAQGASLPRSVGGFLLAFGGLNLCINVTWFHRHVPLFAPLMPSAEILGLMVVLAVLRGRNRRLPVSIGSALTALLLGTVVLRLADVALRHFMRRNLDAARDILLVPELVRLLYSTLPPWQFGLAFAAAAGFGLLLAFLLWRALRICQDALSEGRLRLAVYGASFCLLILSVSLPPGRNGWRAGAFAPSYLPQMVRAGLGALSRGERKAALLAMVEAQRAELSHVSEFPGLAGRDVHLVFVESYGACLLDLPSYRRELEPLYAQLLERLASQGMQVVSSRLSSPTFGGQSPLAHVTLHTGMRVDNTWDQRTLLTAFPVTLASLMGKAGYETVGFWPGTTRPLTDVYRRGFARVYPAFEMGYSGPKYAWAPMPDQYVFDQARRRFMGRTGPPLFVEYVLVSSHFPFSPHPPYIDDWDRIGDGSVYGQVEPVDMQVTWQDRERAPAAFVSAIRYDLHTVVEFAVRVAAPGALFIVLGDHQPLAEVAGAEPSHDVPIHVFSQEPKLLAPFRARGYEPGFVPSVTRAERGMESFLEHFVADFAATGAQGAEPLRD